MSLIKKFFRDEDGQDMIEYGLVISLVVIGGVGGYTAFQGQINNALNTLGNTIVNNL